MRTTAFDVADELRRREAGLGQLKLHKVLYYVQAWHLVWTGEPMYDEVIEAWEMGPVVERLWKCERHKLTRPPLCPLSSAHLSTVARVWNRYGRMSGKVLMEHSHSECPWIEARGKGGSAEITLSDIKDYYTAEADDQAWFWDDEWIAGEREADQDVAAGNVVLYKNAESFLESL